MVNGENVGIGIHMKGHAIENLVRTVAAAKEISEEAWRAQVTTHAYSIEPCTVW